MSPTRHLLFISIAFTMYIMEGVSAAETLCGGELVDTLQFVCGERGFYFSKLTPCMPKKQKLKNCLEGLVYGNLLNLIYLSQTPLPPHPNPQLLLSCSLVITWHTLKKVATQLNLHYRACGLNYYFCCCGDYGACQSYRCVPVFSGGASSH